MQTIQHLGLLQLFQGHPGLITHAGFRIQQHGAEQAFHHVALARLHQIAIEATQGPGAVGTHGRLAIDAQGQQQLGRRQVGLGRPRAAGLGQGTGRPQPHGGDVHLQRPGQRIDHRRIGITPQAPGHGLAHVAVVVTGQQLQQGLHRQGAGVAAEGINRAHPLNGAGGLEQRQQVGKGAGITVFAKNA